MKTTELKTKINTVLAFAAIVLFSTSAQAAGDTPDFLKNIMEVWCTLTSAQGPLVPILAGTAVIVFGVGMFFMEEKGGLMTSAIKIILGIGIVVGAGAILSWFGIGLQCGGASVSFSI